MNDRIYFFRKNLEQAELMQSLISEAISARLSSGKVTADQLADYLEILQLIEGRARYAKVRLEEVLAEEQQASVSEETVADTKEGKNDNNK